MRLKRSFLSVLFIAGCLAAGAPKVLAVDDAILAVVNDEVITAKDLREYMQGIYAQLRVEGRTPEEVNEVMAEYEKKGVDQLIEDRLILSSADKVGVIIRPQAINDKLDDIRKKYPSQDEFFKVIRKEGVTVTDIRKKIENQIKGQAVVGSEVRAKIYIHPQEVTEYFNAHAESYKMKDRVYLDTIFVQSGYGKDASRKKAEEALAAVRGGKAFPAAVAAYSELPSVGEMTNDQLRPEFKAQIDRMAIGDVSDIIEVPNGYYIVKLQGRAEAATATLKDVKDQIYQKLFEEKFRERFRTWIDELRKKAYVEIKS